MIITNIGNVGGFAVYAYVQAARSEVDMLTYKASLFAAGVSKSLEFTGHKYANSIKKAGMLLTMLFIT